MMEKSWRIKAHAVGTNDEARLDVEAPTLIVALRKALELAYWRENGEAVKVRLLRGVISKLH